MENIQVEKLEKIQPQGPAILHLPDTRTVLNLFRRIYPALMIILAVLPMLNTIIFLATNGDNVLSADYIAYVNLITKIADGSYDWRNYGRDSFVNTHFLPIPILLEVIFALLTHWNTFFPIFTGVGMAALRVIFLWDACNNDESGKKSWLLLPLLSALTFGSSAIDVFSFAQTSLTWGFCFLGLSFGIWCFAKVKREWLFSLLIGLAGIVSCWSGAMGLLVWASFFIGMIFAGKRKWWQYAVFLGAAGISVLPYVYYLIIKPTGHSATSIIYSNFNYTNFATTFGWPFSNGTGTNVFPSRNDPAFWAGTFGLIAGVLGVAFYLLSWNTPVRKQGVPAIMLLTFGVITPAQILIFRQFIGPWYSPQLTIYWLGLVILGYVFWKNRKTAPSIFGWIRSRRFRAGLERWLPAALAAWAVLFFLILGVIYATTNITFEDKLLFLRFRSPAAVACLREYKIVPNLCSATLYNGNLTVPASYLGVPLEKNYMSVFAPDQEWSLQGDFVINGKVTVNQNPNYVYKYWTEDLVTEPIPYFPSANQPPSMGVYWTSDLGKTILPWSHYKHLNLFLHAPDAVTWHLTLPDNINEANFVTAVTFSDLTPPIYAGDGATFQIFIQEDGKPEKLVASKSLPPTEHSWQPISFSLKEYAGKSISLRLTEDLGKNAFTDWGLFQYPHIDLKLDPNKMKPVPAENLSKYIPQPSDKDLILNVQNTNLWQPTNAVPATTPGDNTAKWDGTNAASITYNKPINACLSDYSQLYLKIGMQLKGTINRAVRVFYRLNDNSNFQPEPIVLGLNYDSNLHSYFYDLKLLSLDPKVCLTGLNIQVIDFGTVEPVNLKFELADVRFIKNPDALPPLSQPSSIVKPDGLARYLPPYIAVNGTVPTQALINTTSSKTQLITGTDDNWLDLQPDTPKFWPVASGAQIFLYSSVPQTMRFQMMPGGFVANPKAPNGQGSQGTLQVVLNKTPLQEKPLIVDSLYTVDLNLQAGWNTVTLNYKEGFYRPAAFDPKSNNQKQWSFMISGINLETVQPGISQAGKPETGGINY